MTDQAASVDLKQWAAQREVVADLHRNMANGIGDVDALLLQTAKLQEMSAAVSDAIINDLARLHEMMIQMQQQLGNVAQQSYLSLEVTKRKGIATAEEIRSIHEEVMAEAMAEMEAQKEEERKAALFQDPAKLEELEQLMGNGFSQDEASAIVWPNDYAEAKAKMNNEVQITPSGTNIVQFPGTTAAD